MIQQSRYHKPGESCGKTQLKSTCRFMLLACIDKVYSEAMLYMGKGRTKPPHKSSGSAGPAIAGQRYMAATTCCHHIAVYKAAGSRWECWTGFIGSWRHDSCSYLVSPRWLSCCRSGSSALRAPRILTRTAAAASEAAPGAALMALTTT